MHDAFRASAAAALVIASGAALAQTASPEEAHFFPRVLSAPTDYDANFAYAQAAVATRDYEAAIVALERLLYFNPKLTRAKYELGVLYLRLKSYAMAIGYFEQALASPELDDDIRRRIDIMLPAARKQIQPSRFSGVVQLGMGYNSNVPGAPAFGLIRSYGGPAFDPGPYYRAGGANATLTGDITHVYDFENQRGDLWETRLVGVGVAQFRIGALSSMLVEATTGPRLAIAPDALPGATIHPYVVASYGALALGRLASSAGAGVSARFPIGPYFYLEPGAEWRHLDVAQSNLLTQVGTLENTGPVWTASLAAHWAATDRLTFDAKGLIGRNASLSGALSSRRTGFELSARYEFDPPFSHIGWRWSVMPFARYTQTWFDQPDGVVDPFTTRVDKQWRVGTQFDLPITPMFGVAALVQFSRNASSLPNYRSTSWSGLIGPTLRF